MKKNVANQHISANLKSATDGSAFAGTVTVRVTKDNGAPAAGAGTVSSKGLGSFDYAPTQAETNAGHVVFLFTGAGAISVELNVYPTVDFPSVPTPADIWGHTTRSLTTSFPSVPSASDNADAVWQRSARTLTTAFPSVPSVSDIWGHTTRTLTTAFPSVPTASAIADAVWDEAMTGHTTSGSMGAALNAAGSAGDPWATLLPGSYGAGTAGYIVGTNLDAKVSETGGGSVDPGAIADAVWDHATRSLTAGVTVTTNNDKTGYSLSSSFPSVPSVSDIWGHTTRTLTTSFPSAPTAADIWAHGSRTLTTSFPSVPSASDNAAAVRIDLNLTGSLDDKFDALNTNINGVQGATITKNSSGVIHFPMKLTTGGAATGKTVTGQRALGTGSFANVSGTIAEVGDGVYRFSYAAADSNGDEGIWKFSAADCDDTLLQFKTST